MKLTKLDYKILALLSDGLTTTKAMGESGVNRGTARSYLSALARSGFATYTERGQARLWSITQAGSDRLAARAKEVES